MLNLQNKTYSFNGVEFVPEKNVLKIQNAWIPVAMYFDKLLKLYTSELDMSAVNKYKQQLKEVNDKDKQDKSDLKKLQSEEIPNTEIIDRVNVQIEKNKTELSRINEEFSNDETAQAQQTEYNQMLGYALQSLITSYDVIKGFIEAYLVGDKSKLNYEDENILPLISEIVNDFFLSRLQSKAELMS